jgi:uncharacterized protein YjhX (UPF0386 family)
MLLQGAEANMKKLKVVEVCSRNNEIHIVIQEHENDDCQHDVFKRVKVKEIMKRKAAKPLLLLRAE